MSVWRGFGRQEEQTAGAAWEAREWIAQYSIPRAKQRLQRIKQEAEMPEKTSMAAQQEVQKRVKNLDVVASQIADTRPVSFCQFSPDNGEACLASCASDGSVKLWSLDS